MKRFILWAPLLVFLLFLAVFAVGLIKPESHTIRSRMIGQPLPAFALEPGVPTQPGVATADFKDGKPKLLNVFASWCVPCAAEAPQLEQLAKAGVVIHAVAIRDKPEDIAEFLRRYGNPFQRIGSDPTSSVQIALGSSGVPETFVVDGKGVIRYQHIGEIHAENIPELLTELEKAR
ncbi:MAG: DsbE family thiol:disulfide interchange protein [Sphingomonadaceae bacterium]